MLKHLVRKAIERTERQHILAALTHRHWNRKQAARDLAISYRSMLYKIQYYRLDPPELEPRLTLGFQVYKKLSAPTMRRCFTAVALLLFASSFAFSTANVSGKLVNPNPSIPLPVGSFARFELRNCGGNYPQVSGASVTSRQDFPIASDGTWSGLLSRNDEISCNGSFTTYWTLSYFVRGIQAGPSRDFICSQASCVFDGTGGLIPITVYPPPTPPAQPLTGAESVVCSFPVAASTWSCVENMGTQQVVAEFFDLNSKQIFPDQAQATDVNTFVGTFLQPQAGFMRVVNVGNWTPSVSVPNYLISNPTSDQAIAGDHALAVGGSLSAKRIEGVLFADTSGSIGACYTAASSLCVVPPGFNETGTAITMRSGVSILFLGNNSLTGSSTFFTWPGGTHGAGLYSIVPYGGGLFTGGVTLHYTGSGNAILVGNGAGTTDRTNAISNITIDLTGAVAGAVGLKMVNTVYYRLDNISVVGTPGTAATGFVFDGTGNFNGTSVVTGIYTTGLSTSILGTGTVGAGANAMKIIGGTLGCATGGIGIDLEIADSDNIDGVDIESCATAVKLGANAAGNFFRIRQEANTTDFQALAGSSQNVGIVERGNLPVVSDAGTHNHFSRMQDADLETAFIDNVQARAGSNTNFVDRNAVTQAATVANGFEVVHSLVFGSGATVIDASSATHAGISRKNGSGGGNYTGANTTYANVDSTNLCLQLTVPTGWVLSVTASGVLESLTAAVAQNLALVDVGTTCGGAGTTPMTGTERIITPDAAGVFDTPWSTQIAISGDGAAHSISLQAKTSNASDSWGIQNSNSSAAPSMIFTLLPSN